MEDKDICKKFNISQEALEGLKDKLNKMADEVGVPREFLYIDPENIKDIDPGFTRGKEDIDPGIVYDDSKQPTELPDSKWIHYNYNINGKETISADEAAQMVLCELKKEEEPEWNNKCDICGEKVENIAYTTGTYVPFLILCPACKSSIIRVLKLNKL